LYLSLFSEKSRNLPAFFYGLHFFGAIKLNKKISFLLSAVLFFVSGTGLLNAAEDTR